MSRDEQYEELLSNISAMVADENDWISVMATAVCELHHTFEFFNWTGIYRVTEPGVLKIGPYQGTHGCLTIPFDKGVCGASARSKKTQLVPDVSKRSDHIACSATTQSEIVIPICTPDGTLIGVLDVDSDELNAFDDTDISGLEKITTFLGIHYASIKA